MSDLTAAADAIDHLVDALPDHLRLPRWAVDVDQICTVDAAGDRDLIVVDQAGINDGAAVVQLVHALASPDRARALTQLLRAIETLGPLDQLGDRYDHQPLGLVVALDRVVRTAHDLAAHYLGSRP